MLFVFSSEPQSSSACHSKCCKRLSAIFCLQDRSSYRPQRSRLCRPANRLRKSFRTRIASYTSCWRYLLCWPLSSCLVVPLFRTRGLPRCRKWRWTIWIWFPFCRSVSLWLSWSCLRCNNCLFVFCICNPYYFNCDNCKPPFYLLLHIYLHQDWASRHALCLEILLH